MSENIDFYTTTMPFAKGEISKTTFTEAVNAYTPPDELPGCDFIKFGFLNLDSVNLNDPNFLNDGVRAQVDDDALDALRLSLKRGWDTSFRLPAVAEDETVLEGRTRIRAAIDNGESWIPVAVYKRNINTIKNLFSTGIRANTLHKPASRPTINDFVRACVNAYQAMELDRDKDSITEFLHECGIENLWDMSQPIGQGIRTKIVNKVQEDISKLKRTQRDPNAETVISYSKPQAQNFCKNAGYNLGQGTVLLQVDYSADAAEAFYKHVVEAIETKNDPLDIILWSKATDNSADYDTSVKSYVKRFEQVYESCFTVCGLDGPLKKAAMGKKPFRFLGAIPQVKNRPSHMNGSRMYQKIVPFNQVLEQNITLAA